MIKRLTKILITGLFALVLAFGATGIIKPVELKADNSLPSGYTRVDYIQATAGASYINTGVTTNYSHKLVYTGMMDSAPVQGVSMLFGSFDASLQFYCDSSNFYVWAGRGSSYTVSITPSLDNIVSFSFTAQYGQTSTGIFNGVSKSDSSNGNITQNATIHLFGRQQANQANGHLNLGATTRCYSFSVYDATSDAYLCDMIPVIRNSDNAVGMYDRVSNSFKGNANTSGPAFTYGSKLELPSGYTSVPYIENVNGATLHLGDATQFLPANMTIDMTMKVNDASGTYRNLFGWYESNSSDFLLQINNVGNVTTALDGKLVLNSINSSGKDIHYTFTKNGTNLGQTTNGNIGNQTGASLVVRNKMGLFGYWAYTTSSYGGDSGHRLYEFNVYDWSTAQMKVHVVPCIRNSDGVLGAYDTVRQIFMANDSTGSFTTDGTVYVVNNATQFTNALNNAVSGDYVIIANDITIAEQDFAFASGVNIIQNNHTITPPTVTGYGIHSYWYTNSSYTGYTTDAIFSGIHYYAKYLTEIAVSTLQELESAMTTATANDVIVLTADIQYNSETFTNTSQTVINNISYLKPPARTTPWSFNDWYGNGWINNNPIEPNKYLQAGYIASITDETRLDIALETATYLDKISLANDITLTSNSANHPYGNVTGSSFTTKTFNTFSLNSHTISSNAHPNWSIGYAFDDWYSTKWTTALNGAAPSQNTTYYARYEITANSGQNLNFAFSQSLDGDIITLGSNVTMPNEAFSIPANVTFDQNGKTITPPAKSYYTILGWGENGGSSTVSTFTPGNVYNGLYNPDSFPIVYATQTGITYTLPDDAPTSYTYGIGTSLPIPTRDGYSFAGWYSNAQLTGNIINSISTTDHGQKNLFSSWQEKPTSISIGNINVFRNVGDGTTGKGENDDMFVLFTYNISWNNTPTVNVNQWFTFRLMDTDGTTTIATFNPYPYNDYGYGLGVGFFYIPDMVASNLTWNEEYQIRIDANPFAWYSITGLTTTRNIYSGNYTNKTSQDDNRRLLTAAITNIAHQLENNWFVGEQIPYMLISQENNVAHFTSYGMTYFENSIANLRIFTPDLFLSNVIIPDYSEDKNPENADPASLITRWQTQYEGTWLQDAFEGFGGLFHMPWRMVTSIMCLVIWIILAAVSARMFGNTDAGFWAGSVVFATGVSMGIMEYTIIGAGALLIVFYSLYILFWRQG